MFQIGCLGPVLWTALILSSWGIQEDNQLLPLLRCGYSCVELKAKEEAMD